MHDIHSINEFSFIVGRERARSDRTGQYFSLAVFELNEKNKGQTSPFLLAEVLNQRKRSTDEIGWFDTRRIGVILPDTPVEGARKVADDICQRIATKVVPPSFKVYTYSTGSLPEFDWEGRNCASPEKYLEKGAPGQMQSGKEEMCTVDWSEKGIEPLLGYPMPIWKRAMDILGSIAGIVFASPIMILVAFGVKLTSPGPSFFRQKRIGYGAQAFTIYKFRSMFSGATQDLHSRYLDEFIKGKAQKNGDGAFKIKDDPRVTPFGRFLRKWSLDELPQLFNVLKGDMSLVGPRPEPSYAITNYPYWYHRRTMGVKPGITGLWQVTGRSRITYEEMVRLDIRYLQTMSFFNDSKILLRTFIVVITHSGAY